VDAAGSNPFAGVDYYTNPDYVAEVQRTIALNPSMTDELKKAQYIPAAYWIDTISRIGNISRVLDGALAQQNKTGRKTLTVFIVYDLPERDCAAAASNGEILCKDSTCADGIATYKSKYIDPIKAIFKKYPGLPIVAIIEPDSLGNIATNLNVQKCQIGQTAYLEGIAYAISQLSALPNLNIYLDACHGGWLGWDTNRAKIATVFKQVLGMAGGPDLVRGFATNTANYQPLGSLSDTADPCKLETQSNKAINEVIYVSLLTQTLETVGITGKSFIIDTSRNGVTDMRKDCSNWCNINGAGLGMRPTSDTKDSGIDNLDAYFWLKTPGESDGSSDPNAPRYDYHCGSADSFKPSPQAGEWDSDFFVMLVKNAKPPL